MEESRCGPLPEYIFLQENVRRDKDSKIKKKDKWERESQRKRSFGNLYKKLALK